MRIISACTLIGAVAVSIGSPALVQANCNARYEQAPYPDTRIEDCSAGDSTARFGWGYTRRDDTYRSFVRVRCSTGDCGGQAVIGGYSADGKLVCWAEWSNPQPAMCPDSLAYVIIATIGDFE